MGCVKHTGLALDEVMEMPIYMRKNWIRLHNKTEEEAAKKAEEGANNGNTRTMEGNGINAFAKLQINNSF